MRWFKPNIEKLRRTQNITGLLGALQDTDPTIRVATVRALPGLADPRVLHALIAAVSDPEKIVRYEIIRVLGGFKDMQTLNVLLSALGDPEPHVQYQAVESLGKLGKAAIGPLLAALGLEKNETIRHGIIRGLGEIGANEQIVAALMRLLQDRSRKIRYAAAEQLEKIGIFALSFLVAALQEGETEVRHLAHGIIMGICTHSAEQELAMEKLIGLVVEGRERARLEMSSFISRRGLTALKPLRGTLWNKQPEIRSWALRMLTGLHWEPATEEEHVAWLWAKEAWDQLLERGPAALEPLLDALVRGRPEVRQKVAYTLGQLGERRAVDGLITTLLKDQDLRVRQEAITALGALGDERAIEPLLSVWTERGEKRRQDQEPLEGYRTLHEHVATALLRLGPRAIEHIQRAAPPTDPYVQQWIEVVRNQYQKEVEANALANPTQQRQARLLVVEDNASTQLLLRRVLEHRGYAVCVATDGIEALWQLGQQHFDLILSDIGMPHFDGLQLLQFLKQKGVTTPVIFLTAQTEETEELRGLQLGASDYIKKPIQPDVLGERVQRVLASIAERTARGGQEAFPAPVLH